jgi:hypothetical protein
VAAVGDVVGERRDLCLGARLRIQFQIVLGAVLGHEARHPPPQRAVVLDHALERLPGQVEAVKFGIAPLQARDHAQRLRVVIEAAICGERRIERLLAGMPERAVPEIMGERHGLGEVLVQRQGARRGARDLRDLERVGEAAAEVVALVAYEHLGFVLEAAKRRAVHDAIAIALERAAQRIVRLGMAPPPAALRTARERRERPPGAAVDAEAAI